MKRSNSLFVLLSLIFISGCQSAQNNTNYILEFISSPEDVVDNNIEIQNIERFEQFLSNINEGKADEVRIVRYTTEGDPILHVLEFNGETIKSTFDSRRDEYGSGGISQTTCHSIEEVETREGTGYFLEGCDTSIDNLLFSHNKNDEFIQE